MELHRRDMTISGIEFDDPIEFPIPKRDYREYRDGAKTVKEMWVASYRKEGSAVFMDRHCVTMTSRGVCVFDGKQVKDEGEKKKIREMFEGVKTV